VVDLTFARLLLAVLAAWPNGRQQQSIAYLVEENRILRGQSFGRRRLTSDERRRLAVRGHRLGISR
jgi:hypothetical protein